MMGNGRSNTGYGGFNAQQQPMAGYQAPQGFMSPGAQGQDSQEDKRRGGAKNSSMRPVTAKQLLESSQPVPDAPAVLDGHDLKSVKTHVAKSCLLDVCRAYYCNLPISCIWLMTALGWLKPRNSCRRTVFVSNIADDPQDSITYIPFYKVKDLMPKSLARSASSAQRRISIFSKSFRSTPSMR